MGWSIWDSLTVAAVSLATALLLGTEAAGWAAATAGARAGVRLVFS